MRSTLDTCAVLAAGLAVTMSALAAPSIYPTGTTIYDPDRAWNGYTVFIAPEKLGAIVIDMNGNTVKEFQGFDGGAGGPARILPGGFVLSADPVRPGHQESNALIQLDFDGNEVWRFDRTEQVEGGDGRRFWSARQHHDWQREGMPVGYYSPGIESLPDRARTLLLTHKTLAQPGASDVVLEDDYIIEVSWDGEIVWDWLASEHLDEMGFSSAERAAIRSATPVFNRARGSADWLHVNAATYVGPNRWYDEGDTRFHPDNIIISARWASLVAIISRADGSIVWRVGPNFGNSEGERALGQFISQHHAHVIPRQLPGAGNVLVFDNGGTAGYIFADPAAPRGAGPFGRGSSRVVEFNPITLQQVWSYSLPGRESFKFFSHYISSAQRLENGNTMITEGADGRLFEVNTDGEIVWEYVSPYFVEREARSNAVYRAYRLPYNWIPQLERPEERPVVPPALGDFRIAPQ